MQYTIYATQDYMGGWTGEFPDLPGCAPEGDDMEEFLANVQAAVEEWAAENSLTALPQPSDIEPDFSDPSRLPLLVEVDESFLTDERAEHGEEAEAPAPGAEA